MTERPVPSPTNGIPFDNDHPAFQPAEASQPSEPSPHSTPLFPLLHWLARWITSTLGRLAGCGTLVLLLLLGLVLLGNAVRVSLLLPDLRAWHTIILAEEFRHGMANQPQTLEEYLDLEDRLFAELRQRIYDSPSARDPVGTGRYHPSSAAARHALETPYNRTFILRPPDGQPLRGGALLLHGLTDSPYSQRATAMALRDAGFVVLVLRLPGHGTIPSGLRRVRTEDWKAALALGARHIESLLNPDQPFYIGGYSTGATLALIHALDCGDPSALGHLHHHRMPDRIILHSAAVAVTRVAALSDLVSALAIFPALRKVEWLDIIPEYDPYKYASMPNNGGKQVWRLTRELHRRLRQRVERDGQVNLPPVVSFQSLVDSTVRPAEIASRLFRPLADDGNHELIVFDLNMSPPWHDLAASTPRSRLAAALGRPPFPFRITALTNLPADPTLLEVRYEALRVEGTTRALSLRWPPNIVSLGHVAVPFRPDDPIYGIQPASHPDGLPPWPLGAAPPRGEPGSILVPLGIFTRLRSNPFWSYIEDVLIRCTDEDCKRLRATELPSGS